MFKKDEKLLKKEEQLFLPKNEELINNSICRYCTVRIVEHTQNFLPLPPGFEEKDINEDCNNDNKIIKKIIIDNNGEITYE